MDEATIAITVMSGLFAAIFLGFLIWGMLNKQFRNVEEASRNMFKNNVQDEIKLRELTEKVESKGPEKEKRP
jgi:hypothetical protein